MTDLKKKSDHPEADAWFSIYPLCFFCNAPRTSSDHDATSTDCKLWPEPTKPRTPPSPVGLLSARASHVPVWECPWSVASGWNNVEGRGWSKVCKHLAWLSMPKRRHKWEKTKNQPISTNQLSLVCWGRINCGIRQRGYHQVPQLIKTLNSNKSHFSAAFQEVMIPHIGYDEHLTSSGSIHGNFKHW